MNDIPHFFEAEQDELDCLRAFGRLGDDVGWDEHFASTLELFSFSTWLTDA